MLHVFKEIEYIPLRTTGFKPTDLGESIIRYEYAGITSNPDFDDTGYHMETLSDDVILSEDEVIKVVFNYEGRLTVIESDTFETYIGAKKWLMNKCDWLIDMVNRNACDQDITEEYYDAYIKCISLLERNSTVIIEDSFTISLFTFRI